jgi:hypothetical protein
MPQSEQNNGEEAGGNKPPYCAFETFKNFIGHLHDTVMPTQIDTSLMTNMSGGVRSQMMSALRFFDMIGADGKPTEVLTYGVDVYGKPEWKDYAVALSDMYKPRAIGDLNIDSATAKELEDAFKIHGGVEGSTREKAIRFYLKLLEEGDVQFSAHFKKIRRSSGSGGTRRKKKPAAEQPSPAAPKPERVPQEMDEYPLPFSGKPAGKLIAPKNPTALDVQIIEAMLNVVRLKVEKDD